MQVFAFNFYHSDCWFQLTFLCIVLPQADAIIEKIKNGVSEENDVKPTIVIAADTVCFSFNLRVYTLN